MKIAAMFADGTGGTVDRPDPKAIDDFVVVKIRSVPMCTEYKGFIKIKLRFNDNCIFNYHIVTLMMVSIDIQA